MRAEALSGLASLGSPGRSAVLALLESADASVRCEALRVLGAMRARGSAVGARELLPALGDSDPRVAAVAGEVSFSNFVLGKSGKETKRERERGALFSKDDI